MKQKRLKLFIIQFAFGMVLSAQTVDFSISFTAFYNNDSLKLSEPVSKLDSSLSITMFKFYLSNFRFFMKEVQVFEEARSHHLIDFSSSSVNKLSFEIPSGLVFDKIQFHLGVDSVCNVSGVQGGDLDPTQGMYWAWQSGYINLKLEGNSLRCDTRKNKFQFHLGGYQYPFETLQTLSFPIENIETLAIIIDLNKLVDGIDISNLNEVMSPSVPAQRLSELAKKTFYINAK
ncbi:MAG: MbnP family protein [Bacteroidia bacterium]